MSFTFSNFRIVNIGSVRALYMYRIPTFTICFFFNLVILHKITTYVYRHSTDTPYLHNMLLYVYSHTLCICIYTLHRYTYSTQHVHICIYIYTPQIHHIYTTCSYMYIVILHVFVHRHSIDALYLHNMSIYVYRRSTDTPYLHNICK